MILFFIEQPEAFYMENTGKIIMDRQNLIRIGIVFTLIVALSGTAFSAYVVLAEDPFSEDVPENEDVPIKDPSAPGEENDPETEEEIPSWMMGVVGASLISAMIFLGLSGMVYMKAKRGENMVRMDLLDLITVNPGINLTSIRRELQLSQGAVSYHIMKLEKSGKILSEKGSKERRYYPSSMGYSKAMALAHKDEVDSILANETSRTIAELLKKKTMSQNEIVQALDVSPSTVHWHMERMKKAEMIRKEQRGRSVYYELLDLPDMNT
jgi:predicted transcriptional regulator